MTLNILFADICQQLLQGKKNVTIPPNTLVPVTEEDGMKIVAFSANGMNFEGRFNDDKLWVVRPDGDFVAEMQGDRVVKSNPAYGI